MTNKAHITSLLATVFLLIYVILIQANGPLRLILALFAFSPFVIVLVTIAVLKFDQYHGPGLGDREFGYQDSAYDQALEQEEITRLEKQPPAVN